MKPSKEFIKSIKSKRLQYLKQTTYYEDKFDRIMYILFYNVLKRPPYIRQRMYPFLGKGGIEKFFVLDFYFNKIKLVVEIDGGIHNRQENYDFFRDILLAKAKILTIRIKNEELNDIKKVKFVLDIIIDKFFLIWRERFYQRVKDRFKKNYNLILRDLENIYPQETKKIAWQKH